MTTLATLRILAAAGLMAASGLAAPVQAQRYQNELRHSPAVCQGTGPAVMLNITGIRAGTGA